MNESKHTPGPWFDWKNEEWIYEPQKLLANYEDACLIAAAPELLEACEAALRLDYMQEHNALANQLRAAVAKAKGEQQCL